ncbi:MAG: UDP-N-acetylmuramate--L-alanine ligase [Muribaculum sp.]|nr:UDP-N-acetylmuramate--L-alanine ligase [Muribaculum sp.]
MNIYFIGAGGIGMANLVRYYLSKGVEIAGYDRTSTPLTDHLAKEGAILSFEDNEASIPEAFRNPGETLAVYTPAIPADNRIFTYFRDRGFRMMKRAALLGDITRRERAICISGSHGKTTTCCMTAWILAQTPQGCNAFLGGILRNTDSNLMLSEKSDLAVVEADEYDRSFHRLSPWIAVVTSTDPDHLDIYGDEQGYLEGFRHFTTLIRPGGYLLMHTGLKLKPQTPEGVKTMTYSGHLHAADPEAEPKGDWWAENVKYAPGRLFFTLCGPQGLRIDDIELGVPVEINIDNAVAAAASALLAGASREDVKKGLASFRGASRRFEIWMRGDAPEDHGHILIDDYAHSPREVAASIESVRKLYPGRKLSVIFQPHLYTRTRDFAPEFARALSAADEVILPEIYPAREEPIEGVDSQLILKDVTTDATYCERKNLLNLIKNRNFEILMTLGAADINVLLPEIKEILRR